MDVEKLTKELERDEAFIPHVYPDSLGYWTIGIGRLIDKRKGGKISYAEAKFMLANDIREKEAELIAKWPAYKRLPPGVQRAVLNMAFNLGVTGLMQFKTTLGALEDGDFKKAAASALQSKWASQVGARATRIADLIRKGE